eukprot:141213_1
MATRHNINNNNIHTAELLNDQHLQGCVAESATTKKLNTIINGLRKENKHYEIALSELQQENKMLKKQHNDDIVMINTLQHQLEESIIAKQEYQDNGDSCTQPIPKVNIELMVAKDADVPAAEKEKEEEQTEETNDDTNAEPEFIEFKWNKESKQKKLCDTMHTLYLLHLALARIRARTIQRNKYFKSIGRSDRYINQLDSPQIITNFLDWQIISNIGINGGVKKGVWKRRHEWTQRHISCNYKQEKKGVWKRRHKWMQKHISCNSKQEKKLSKNKLHRAKKHSYHRW